ncbi:MAG TPA: methylated-DNA--[protein]-cysteine S-methyltransferase [Gaiellaceae bacterium]|jgi:methylated-DNA-[protein]-cysteine S-methyltransferase
MRPKLVRYEAPGFGVGELWLDGDLVLWSEHPRPARPMEGSHPGHVLARRLQAFFSGEPDDFRDVELDVEEDGFFAECARALRAVPRGEVVTYGELAALAGRPGAARAAGTFCGRNKLGVFIPCHRVVSAGGIGTFGDLGVDYKRRMLALEGVVL